MKVEPVQVRYPHDASGAGDELPTVIWKLNNIQEAENKVFSTFKNSKDTSKYCYFNYI